ncbi:unnamed protein product [Urochloa humidicola]
MAQPHRRSWSRALLPRSHRPRWHPTSRVAVRRSPKRRDEGTSYNGCRRRAAPAVDPVEDVRRERSRSPGRCDTRDGCSRGRRREVPAIDVSAARRQHDLKLLFDLRVDTMDTTANKMFNLRPEINNTAAPRSVLQLFSNVSRLTDRDEDESCFDSSKSPTPKVPATAIQTTLPVDVVFGRIKQDLRCGAMPAAQDVHAAPTIQEVDAALQQLQTQAKLDVREEQVCQDVLPEGLNVHHATPTHLATSPTAQDASPHAAVTQACAFASPSSSASSPSALDNHCGIADLFSTPEQGILAQPPSAPPKKGRRLKKQPVKVSSLRRSKRQACSKLKHLPAEERANYVLCKRLGYIKDDLTPAEQAIQEFVASFQGPMPQFSVAGLTALFRLEDDDICNATEALIRLGGPEVAEGLLEINNA